METIDSLESVSIRIRQTRKSLGISQKRLAAMAGMSQSTVARLEGDINSLNPSYSTIYKVMGALDRVLASSRTALNKKVYEVMHRNIVYARPDNTIAEAIKILKNHDFTQLPVLDRNKVVVGTVYQKDLLMKAAEDPGSISKAKVKDILSPSLPQIDKNADFTKIRPILEQWNAALVVEKNKAVGIVTIYDILKFV